MQSQSEPESDQYVASTAAHNTPTDPHSLSHSSDLSHSPQHPAAIAPLTANRSLRFSVDFSIDHRHARNWYGSDLWAIQHGLIGVTPLSSTLTECSHTHAALNGIAKMYPPATMMKGHDECKADEDAAGDGE